MECINLIFAASAVLILPLCVALSAGHKYQSSDTDDVLHRQERFLVTDLNAGWNPWSPWSVCSSSCRGGAQARGRSCNTGVTSECNGQSYEVTACNLGPCSDWNPWSPWSVCSYTCGEGLRARGRSCESGVLSDCDGSNYEVQNCTLRTCSVWNEWSPWSACSHSCGGGFQIRDRMCNGGVNSDCDGLSYDSRECTVIPCSGVSSISIPALTTEATGTSLDGYWNSWSNWSTCTTTCGGGQRNRTRQCIYSATVPHGGTCSGNSSETETCNNNLCPLDGYWNSWSNWSICTSTCGGGQRNRTRECIYSAPYPHGGPCSGNASETEICNNNLCPVDGYWNSWSNWSTCTTTCGGGQYNRTRQCIYSAQFPHGGPCSGNSSETETCNNNLCPLDGYWNSWSNWSICTSTCGGGQRNRTRECIYSAPYPHGGPCSGNESETEICNNNLCPVDGYWNSWSNWSTCTTTCGGGQYNRTRQCIYSAQFPHGGPCSGNSSETEICNNKICPVDGYWNSWSNWSICTTTCGGGQHNRTRECVYSAQFPHGGPCSGNSSETEICNNNLCPVDGYWNSWSNWSICTTTCGGGQRNRTRECVYSAQFPHGGPCSGNSSETEICNNNRCPVDGYWNSWSNWSICTTTCGGGQHNRTRECIYSAQYPHGAPCSGNSSDTAICNSNLCPVDGYWNSWSNWSTCTTTCGGGQHNRTRQCIYSAQFPHGGPCSGNSSETEICNVNHCPVDGLWNSWSKWSICTTTCGGGHHNRTRKCIYSDPFPHGSPCSGNSSETEICSNNLCPVDGIWNSWSKWSVCTTTCGGGQRNRTRECVYSAQFPHGGPCSGNSSEIEICNNNLCPVDGLWNSWSKWSICTTTCGGGQHNRTRECIYSAQFPHGGPCSGNSSETQICNNNLCPVDGLWNSWSQWSICTTTCGGGHHNRTRKCVYSDPFPHGSPCSGNSSETEICSNNLCPVDGLWNAWSGWSTCTTTCGGGQRTRTRHCDYSPLFPHGAPCTGNASDSETCNKNLCPVDGLWNPWSEWSNCTSSCGTGYQTRTRQCIYSDISPHGADCIGISSETKICNNLCPATCATCGDYPTILCESIYRQNTACPEPYCVNVLVNNALGDRSLERRCGSLKECKEDWWQKSSLLDKCKSFDQRLTYREAFNCTFCCTTPNCNEDINPNPASLYKGT